MSRNIQLHKGLNIPLKGAALGSFIPFSSSGTYAVKPTDFRGLVPKLLVREGDPVQAGTPLFASKNSDSILFCSPVSGTVSAILRGDKRKLLSVCVLADGQSSSISFPIPETLSPSQITDILLQSGCWPLLVQRPYGIIPDPAVKPRDIFISGFDTAPLAPDMDFALKGEADALQKGFDVLQKLCDNPIRLSLSDKTAADSPLRNIKGADVYSVKGPHPAGNVGVQISHIAPINKGDIVWTIDPQALAIIGRLFLTGTYNPTRTYVLCGTEASQAGYFKAIPGFCASDLKPFIKTDGPVRIISGNALCGEAIASDGFVGLMTNQITLLPEVAEPELLGWANPLRLKKYSFSHGYLSFLLCRRKYNLDTCINGGPRPFVQSGIYEKVLPMDIYATYLIKAILAEDIDKMEELGIYEVLEEDLALCEFICPSKIQFQQILGKGIDLMLKEM